MVFIGKASPNWPNSSGSWNLFYKLPIWEMMGDVGHDGWGYQSYGYFWHVSGMRVPCLATGTNHSFDWDFQLSWCGRPKCVFSGGWLSNLWMVKNDAEFKGVGAVKPPLTRLAQTPGAVGWSIFTIFHPTIGVGGVGMNGWCGWKWSPSFDFFHINSVNH